MVIENIGMGKKIIEKMMDVKKEREMEKNKKRMGEKKRDVVGYCFGVGRKKEDIENGDEEMEWIMKVVGRNMRKEM